MARRDLGFAELPNARDLGGYQATDGRTIRTGTLFRADSLSLASRADVATLAGMGVGLVRKQGQESDPLASGSLVPVTLP